MIFPADPAQIEAVAAMLADAFADDPLQCYVLPDRAERRARSHGQFATLVRHGLACGQVLATAEHDGVAAWLPPDPQEPAGSDMSQLPGVLGDDAFLRFGGALDYLTRVHGASTPTRAWYLMVIGVAPARQRQGIGAALLAPILARADAERVPCCLDTAQPKTRTFYEGLGFRVVVDTVDPTSGVRFWTFQRDPR